jgi:hypothetical protein
MANYDVCAGGARELAAATLCLDELSKDGKGELKLLASVPEDCSKLDCVTLTAEHFLFMELTSHPPCDSPLGSRLDGRFAVRNLTTVFVGGTGERRGMHTGEFDWWFQVGALRGSLSGMTNEGTHRDPVFGPVQTCDERGVMEGRLCGRMVRSLDPDLVGAQVFGVYRIRFDPSADGGSGPASGTFEGVVVRECPIEL